jgi:hypothetical protein
LLDAWSEFSQKLSPITISDIINQPLWHNSQIKFEYIKQWDNKGLCYMADLFNTEGKIMSMEDLKIKYGIGGTILDYYRLVKSIPKLWITKIADMPITAGPRIMPSVQILCSTKTGCKAFYNILVQVNNTSLNCEQKWYRDLQIVEVDIDWKSLLLTIFNYT